MAHPTPNLDTALAEMLQKLVPFENRGFPVVSLYLNLAPNQHGRETWDVFTRKAFAERAESFTSESAQLESLERDVERIQAYLASISPAANGVAIFASSGNDGFFEATPLEVAIDSHWLFIGEAPQIYPLVRLIDQYPRYAVVAVDTQSAHIVVCGLGTIEERADVQGTKTRRHMKGGLSQARYQRHIDNLHLHHLKEVVDTLDRIVRRDRIHAIVIAGDDVVSAQLKAQLPEHLAGAVVDVMRLNRQAGEEELAAKGLELLKRKDAETDAERVHDVVGAWLGGALGVAGPEAVVAALQMGQVEELLITAAPQLLTPVEALPDAVPAPAIADTFTPDAPDAKQLQMSQELVARAQQNGARIRFIEDAELLRPYGGVAAALRFRI